MRVKSHLIFVLAICMFAISVQGAENGSDSGSSNHNLILIQNVHEKMASSLSTLMSEFSKTRVTANLIHVNNVRVAEFVRQTYDPALVVIMGFQDLPGFAAVTLPLPLVYTFLDRHLERYSADTSSFRKMNSRERRMVRAHLEKFFQDFPQIHQTFKHHRPYIVEITYNFARLKPSQVDLETYEAWIETSLPGETGIFSFCYQNSLAESLFCLNK